MICNWGLVAIVVFKNNHVFQREKGYGYMPPKRTTNHGQDHPFVVCQVMSQKYGTKRVTHPVPHAQNQWRPGGHFAGV